MFMAGAILKAEKAKPAPAASAGRDAATAHKIDFKRDIAPIFEASCVACHGAEKPLGQLRLDSETALLRGGISGKVIVAGKSGESLLVRRLLGQGGAPRMPMGPDALPKAKLELIRAWIDQGLSTAEASSASLAADDSATSAVGTPTAQAESGLFVTRIRPILAARCYQCHGPEVQQNGLRVDSLAALLKGSATGKVLVPGSSEKSRLVRRLLGLDKPMMPYGGPPLSQEEIQLVRDWINQGALGPDSAGLVVAASKPVKHWAYLKPVRPEAPKTKNPAWCRNPIDNFVLARLEKEGLTPSPEADRESLIRRVSLDLIGLPPTLQEVDAFLADKSPEAYEKVVDRLLASPHYGERWARPWLDLARYADTNGYEKDNRRTAWKYRDWVINALNQDMSFRQFTIEQLAGDMLPNPTTDQLIATGFHRNTMLNQEGGIDHMEYYWYSLVDRANTTASVWLGSTLACAQCHNHKFDPFTQKDYYRMLAFFDNAVYQDLNLGQGQGWVEEPSIELPTPEQEAKAKELRAEIAKLQQVLDTSTSELEAAQANWERQMKAAPASWAVLHPATAVSKGGATLKVLDDQSVLATGKNPQADTYAIETTTDLPQITGVRLEVFRDSSLPLGGPGRDPEGNFFLSALEVEASPADQRGASVKIAFSEAYADEAQAGYAIRNLLPSDTPGPRGWAIETTSENPPQVRQAVLIPDKPFGFGPGTRLTIRLKHEMFHASRNLGRFRLSVTSDPDPKFITSVPAKLRPVMDIPVEKRTPGQKKDLAAVYRSLAPALEPTREKMAELQKSLQDLGIVTTLIVRERPSYDRPFTYLRVRGSFMSKADIVYAGFPAIFGPAPESLMPNRLGLAEWLVSEDNPLTARVTVNRFLEALFGRGIVETSEDFGTQGERPTNPELLDWLATEFMRQQWSMKKILRLMVTSATYRQSSRVTPELQELDPYNKLLARGPRFRVDAEIVRDIALSVSGLLSQRIGGPSVFPYQPEGVWDRPYNDDKWVISEGEDRHRRALYTFIRRTSPYPPLITFDAPTREFCTVRRVRTNTPLQALTTLNDPAFFEAAQALARIMVKEGGPDTSAKLRYGFRRVTPRDARPRRKWSGCWPTTISNWRASKRTRKPRATWLRITRDRLRTFQKSLPGRCSRM